MDTILILDTETDGTHDGAVCIEVAACLYSVRHAAPIRSFASLIRAESNAAEGVNRIAPALLLGAPLGSKVWETVGRFAATPGIGAVIAHNAEFDRRFVPGEVYASLPWICSMDDLAWPRATKPAGESLINLALTHGLGVAHAHRAAADVDLLARLFTRAAEMGVDLGAMLARGMRPKALFQALVPFDRKDEAKAHGFKWNEPVLRAWTRRMAIDDVDALPFDVRNLDDEPETLA